MQNIMYCNEKNVKIPILKIKVFLLVKRVAKFKHRAMCFHWILQAAKSGLPSCELYHAVSRLSAKTEVRFFLLLTPLPFKLLL